MSPFEQQNVIGSEPAWEVAFLFPSQGNWSEQDYLLLQTNRMVEFSDGKIEVLDTSTEQHQMIVAFLYQTIFQFISASDLGTVLFAPLRVKLWEGKFREPDVVFMQKENAGRRGNQFWDGADLAVEVVSEDDPSRDVTTKRQEYARAGIREYWIVDPRDQTITVFALDETNQKYLIAGKYDGDSQAESVLLPGLSVDVANTFKQHSA